MKPIIPKTALKTSATAASAPQIIHKSFLIISVSSYTSKSLIPDRAGFSSLLIKLYESMIDIIGTDSGIKFSNIASIELQLWAGCGLLLVPIMEHWL